MEIPARDSAEFRRMEKEMLAEREKRRQELTAIQYKNHPPHPGVYIREEFLRKGDLTPWLGVSELAEDLGVSRKTISQIVNGRGGITAEMAVRLNLAFGADPELWLMRQMKHDLWKAEQKRDEIDFVMRRRRAFWKP